MEWRIGTSMGVIIVLLFISYSITTVNANNIMKNDNFALDKVPFPYPVAASWFKDRYYEEEWDQTLDKFGKQGGHIVWQRGRPLRKIDPIDIFRFLIFFSFLFFLIQFLIIKIK